MQLFHAQKPRFRSTVGNWPVFLLNLPKTAKLAKIAIFEARYLKKEAPDQKSETKRFFQPIKIKFPTFCFLPLSTHLKALGICLPPNPGFGHLGPKMAQNSQNGQNGDLRGQISKKWGPRSKIRFLNLFPTDQNKNSHFLFFAHFHPLKSLRHLHIPKILDFAPGPYFSANHNDLLNTFKRP